MGNVIILDKSRFKKVAWERALFRLGQTHEEIYDRNNHEEIHNFLKKFVLYSVKCNQAYSNQELKKYSSESLSNAYEAKVNILTTVSYMTYREFIELFPIDKEFHGYKNERKDYFSVIEYIENNGGMDARINHPFKLFWAYNNWEITEYILDVVDISDELHYRKNGEYIEHDFY